MIEQGTILVDTYEIEKEIGAGGGGVVYKAKHLRLNSYVVVKRLRDEVVGVIDPKAEADILKKLKHPYLPRIYDFIEQEDGIYTVMDFVEGEGLDKIINRQKAFPQKAILTWGKQLGKALEYLHSQKPPIVHSDIKPSNIMISPDGKSVCLIDFNISSAIVNGHRISLGFSEGYAAPEQYGDGESEPVVDERSDIFSLGCVLYQLASGIPLPRDYTKIIPLHETNTKVSEGLIAIIEKMMQIEPDRRYQNGKEFLDAISNPYKPDPRYIYHNRAAKILFALFAFSLILGAALIGGGLNVIRLDEIATYEDAVLNADAMAETGNISDALTQIRECQKMEFADGKAYEREAYYLYLNGEYDACITSGKESIANQNMSATEDSESLGNLFYVMGNAAFELEEYQDAASYLAQAVEYVADNALYYRDLCVTYAKLGHLEEAQSALETAVGLDLNEDSINFAQAELDCANGNYDEAITAFEQVLNTTSDASLRKRAVMMYALFLNQCGRLSDEIELLETELLQPDNQENLVLKEYLAAAYMRLGEQTDDTDVAAGYYQQSAELYEEMIKDGLTTWQCMENLAILWEKTQDFDAARLVLEEMLEEYPNDYRVYKRLAFLEADIQQYRENENRDYSKMKAYYEKAVELYDTSIDEQEMEMLAVLMEDLEDGGWFQ